MLCKIKRLIGIAGVLCTAAALSAAAAVNENQSVVDRYAIYVASNEGGPGRETLWYANSDAVKLADTMTEIGGIPQENTYLLLSPTKQAVDRTVDEISNRINKSKTNAKRTEFIFYYSGHSDENALLFGDHSYGYEDLKTRINEVPSDVHVVILDSCFSGNFVRAKGGQRQKSFLVDDSNIVKGHAYLTSSSESEASQESDSIQASFFSHAMVTGLRGAADSSGDGKVSLNELYHYAFNETIALTENSSIGPQHPAYNITLVGSGDLVLTDISSAESVLMIPSEAEGRFLIRTDSGKLVSEINKAAGSKTVLALPAGSYVVTVITGTATSQANIKLYSNETYLFDSANLKQIKRTANATRGTAEYAEETVSLQPVKETAPTKTRTPVVAGIIPGLTIPFKQDDLVFFSVNLFAGKNSYVNGMQASSLVGIVSNDLNGIQGAGLVSIANGSVNGVQGAGLVSIAGGLMSGVQGSGLVSVAGSVKGIQGSGLVSIAGGLMSGIQGSGLVSVAGSGKGIQGSGLVSVSKGGFSGLQAAGLVSVSTGQFKGFQSAGLVNTAKNIKGLQAAGLINVADSVQGLQIAPINFARTGGKGVAIGLFNIILDGIASPAFYFDTEGNIFVQYQGGTKAFYTTWIAGTDSKFSGEYVIAGFGFGCRAGWKHFSIDTEVIWKNVFDIPYLSKQEPTSEAKKNTFGSKEIPSARITANLSVFKHLSFFAAFNTDVYVEGWNDQAFSLWEHKNPWSFSISGTSVSLYPSFSFGIKF